jgi:hypothetical protein
MDQLHAFISRTHAGRDMFQVDAIELWPIWLCPLAGGHITWHTHLHRTNTRRRLTNDRAVFRETGCRAQTQRALSRRGAFD